MIPILSKFILYEIVRRLVGKQKVNEHEISGVGL